MRKFQIFKKEYILIEDINNEYQPFHKEYERKTSPSIKEKSYTKLKKKNTVRHGYCEVCYTKYTDYYQHIKTVEHREYAMDDNNYLEVDNIICTFNNKNAVFKSSSPTFYKTPGTVIDIDGSLSYCNDYKGCCDTIILSADENNYYLDDIVPDVNNFINDFLLKSEQ